MAHTPRVSLLRFQALVAELHRRALVEYVRPLLRGRLRCSSARTRSRVAGRLREDAAQLQRLFRRLVSVGTRLGGFQKPGQGLASENLRSQKPGGEGQGSGQKLSANFWSIATSNFDPHPLHLKPGFLALRTRLWALSLAVKANNGPYPLF